MSFWNEENTALAVKLWDQGLSASQIAMEICAGSRNVIIGKINRMRAAGHPFKRPLAELGSEERKGVERTHDRARGAITKASRPRAAKKPKRTPQNNLAAYNVARRAEIEVKPSKASLAAEKAAEKVAALPPIIFDASFAKPWTERRFGECAFPILGDGADTISCCIATKGKTYCTGHAKVMFRPVPKLEKKSARAEMRRAA